jgi:hypothetical protein
MRSLARRRLQIRCRPRLVRNCARGRGPITPIRSCCDKLGRPACRTITACGYGSRIGARHARLSGTTVFYFSATCDCPDPPREGKSEPGQNSIQPKPIPPYESDAFTRSGVMGSSRRRRPVACAKAFASAAELGGSEPSPAPNDGSLRSIRTTSILGTSENPRMG